jgi:iron complex transport system ATP-binding protein
VKILQVIQDLADRGMTIIMASHTPDHAFLVSNIVAIMNNGGIAQKGAPEDVITDDNLRKTYGVDVRVIRLEDGSLSKACFPALKKPAR